MEMIKQAYHFSSGLIAFFTAPKCERFFHIGTSGLCVEILSNEDLKDFIDIFLRYAINGIERF